MVATPGDWRTVQGEVGSVPCARGIGLCVPVTLSQGVFAQMGGDRPGVDPVLHHDADNFSSPPSSSICRLPRRPATVFLPLHQVQGDHGYYFVRDSSPLPSRHPLEVVLDWHSRTGKQEDFDSAEQTADKEKTLVPLTAAACFFDRFKDDQPGA
ncbi:hypothetical protein ZWY2020_004496 [Hordeum vulgare]|nr:hypothetical protein ZWY2020_004496 [Hordeum vulgare]